jgi:hypothetical protein
MSTAYISNSAAVWRNGANCNFFGGIAKIFRARKELKLAFRLDFLFLFHQGKRKIENEKISSYYFKYKI